MKENNRDRHPSYGVVQVSRISGGDGNFFGTELIPSSFVEVRFFQGEQYNNEYGEQKVWPDSVPCFSVKLTHNQWAEMITNLNSGMGGPCTIRVNNFKRIADCPPQRQTIDLSLESLSVSMSEDAQHDIDSINHWLERIKTGKAFGKKEMEELSKTLDNLKGRHKNNAKFYMGQLNKQAEKLVVKIKSETDAILGSKIFNLGLDVLKNPAAIKLLSEDKKE